MSGSGTGGSKYGEGLSSLDDMKVAGVSQVSWSKQGGGDRRVEESKYPAVQITSRRVFSRCNETTATVQCELRTQTEKR